MKTIAVTFLSKDKLSVPVMLVTVPTLTPDKAAPQFGRWVSTTNYVGKKYVGLYYLRRVSAPACASDEQLWLGMCHLPNNPYAFFFDTEDEAQARYGQPFMFWDHVYLDLAPPHNSGRGKLDKEFVSGSGFEFDWKVIGG